MLAPIPPGISKILLELGHIVTYELAGAHPRPLFIRGQQPLDGEEITQGAHSLLGVLGLLLDLPEGQSARKGSAGSNEQ